MKRPNNPRQPVAATTRAYADALPAHPAQGALLEAAVRLCTADVIRSTRAANSSGLAPTPENMSVARAEYDAALHAMIFEPTEDRFICIWSQADNAAYLALFITEAWHSEPGRYGKYPPQHWHQKQSNQLSVKENSE